MDMPGLPGSYDARRPTLADAPAIFELVDACDRQLLGRPDSTLAEVREMMEIPRSPVDRDHWLVERDGTPVGWACTMDDGAPARVDFDVYVHPGLPDRDRTAVRDALFASVLGRLSERARNLGGGALTTVVGCVVGDAEYEQALVARGFAARRRFSRMRIDLTPDWPLSTAPQGVVLEPFDQAADWEEWYSIYHVSFADHWGHEETSVADFRASVAAMDRPELDRWRFAQVDGRRAAVCQTSGRYADHGGGWILNLGVLPEARGRGVGRYLLQHALASYAADGRAWAGLGVDTKNVTGALRLYESVGMTPVMQIDAYERQIGAS